MAEEIKYAQAQIDSISTVGILSVTFNYDMLTNFNLSQLNSSIIDIYMVPANQRHLEEQNFNMSQLNFTWEVESFEIRTMVIKLNFSCSMCISP